MTRNKNKAKQPKGKQQAIQIQLAQSTPSSSREILDDFECAVVMHYDFVIGTKCPHCQKNHGVVNIMDFEDCSEDEKDFFIGEIVQCLYCANPIIILQFPIIPIDEPIFLKWTVFKKQMKEGETSIMSKAELVKAADQILSTPDPL